MSCISSNTMSSTRPRVHVFTSFDAAGKMYRVGVDSFAEISLISAAIIQGLWQVTELHAAPVRMVGIGGGKIASKAVTLPISLQWAQKPVDMQLYVGDTPEGVDILMGLDIQEPLGTIIDRPASVIRFQSQKVEVKTESTAKVTNRMKTPPITVVATNAGCNFAYAAVRNAGFTVQKMIFCRGRRSMSTHHRHHSAIRRAGTHWEPY